MGPVLLAALGLGFALLPLAQGNLFFYWDNAKQHLAQTQFLRDSLRQGSLPQWWPAVGLGSPVTAEGQAAHYSPLRVALAFVLSPGAAMMWEIGICFALGGLGTYFFLRRLNCSQVACTLGGVCQMLGSFSVVFVRNMALHRAMCLLPWAMLCAERFAVHRRVRDLLGAALIVGLQFLSGHPMFAVVTAIATTSYVCFRELQRNWQRSRALPVVALRVGKGLVAWGCALALAFCLAGVQTLPTLLHVKESVRDGGLQFDYAMRALGARPSALGMYALPYAYPQGDRERQSKDHDDLNVWASAGVYPGAVAAVLALAAILFVRRPGEMATVLALSWLVATALALGGRTPLFPALWSLPGLQGMRFPHRFLFWSQFCVATLAALGLDRLLVHARAKRRIPLAGNVRLVGLALVCLASCGAGWMLFREMRAGVAVSALFLLAALAAVAGVTLVPRRWRAAAAACVVLFLTFDLLYFRARGDYARTVSIHEALSVPATVQFLKSQPGQFRVMSLVPLEQGWSHREELRELVQADLCALWDVASSDFYASLILRRQLLIREGIVAEIQNRPEAAAQLAAYLGALNVGYVVAPKEVSLPGWEQVFASRISNTWKNPSLLPPEFLVGQWRREENSVRPEWENRARDRVVHYYEMAQQWYERRGDAQILDRIMEEPVDYRRVAVVDRIPAPPGEAAEGTVRRLPSRPDSMLFEAQSKQAALLVVSESYYPGWRAWVNGHEVRIARANYLVMGIPVPAGTSRVELRYVTPGFRMGRLLSAVSLALMAGVFLFSRGQRNRLLQRLYT